MAKNFRIYTNDLATDFLLITDGVGDQETFFVTEVRGLDPLEIQKGMDFDHIAPITQTEIISKVADTGVACNIDLYDEDTFVEQLVTA